MKNNNIDDNHWGNVTHIVHPRIRENFTKIYRSKYRLFAKFENRSDEYAVLESENR